jgi:hypothetical protein
MSRVALGAVSFLLLSVAIAAAADPIPVVQSAKTGPWSAGGTWVGGNVPGPNVKVQILPGHVVT